MTEFAKAAGSLARNPLGIIALFIVLVYGFAALVTGLGGSLSISERLPLIWFLVVFPVLVLVAFVWLVSQHPEKLYAPSDFQDEENYMKLLAAASMGAASERAATEQLGDDAPDIDLTEIANTIQKTVLSRRTTAAAANRRVLWVDDRPRNNVNEQRALENLLGLSFILALSTSEALNILKTESFAVIISDMGRREGPREGYVLLDAIRESGDRTPFIIYAGSNLPEHKKEVLLHGGHGSTNNPNELLELVRNVIPA